MNENRANINAWIEVVCIEWLSKWESASFRPSIKKLIDKMKNMVTSPEKFDDAWKLIEQIEKMQELLRDESRSYSKESPQMLLECGIAAHEMGNSREAIRFLRGAINIYTDAHDRAVARWLLGCVYWHLKDEVNALSCWEISLNDFRDLQNRTSKNTVQTGWYENLVKVLSGVIRQAAEMDGPPPVPFPSTVEQNAKMHLLRSLPVIREIPAGTPRGAIPEPVDHMEVDRVRLGGREYKVLSLRLGERVVMLQSGVNYYILRVTGTSMNRATPEPIEDGDYVIMRKQDQARPRDIVAAEIVGGIGQDERATLKRYIEENGDKYLQPESSDPQWTERMKVADSFTKSDGQFYIRGVAIAVLKPLPRSNSG